MKKPEHQKALKISLISIAAIVALGALLLAWLYTGQITNAKTSFYKTFNLPAGFVNFHEITLNSLQSRYQLLKSTPEGKAQANAPQIKDQILSKLIRDKEISLLANKYGVSVSEISVTNLYNQMVSQLTGGNEEQFQKAIGEYAVLNKQSFQESVLRSLLLERALTSWYNSQKTLNPSVFSDTQSIQAEAQNGADFGALAKKYSNDQAGAVFSGDSGFISLADLAPEIQSALADAKPGDIKLVFSFDGAHIIKVLEKDESGQGATPRVRVQQIFLQENGFETWFAGQAKGFSVTRLTSKLSF